VSEQRSRFARLSRFLAIHHAAQTVLVAASLQTEQTQNKQTKQNKHFRTS
jgi:hypothetical protein